MGNEINSFNYNIGHLNFQKTQKPDEKKEVVKENPTVHIEEKAGGKQMLQGSMDITAVQGLAMVNMNAKKAIDPNSIEAVMAKYDVVYNAVINELGPDASDALIEEVVLRVQDLI